MDKQQQPVVTAENLLLKIVADVKACVADLKEEFEENGSSPLTDDSPSLNRFCTKMELLLQIGMKDKTGLFGGQKGYWNYMAECLSNNKNLKDGLRFVKSRTEVKTNTGKGRAFIRFSLTHHRMADTLQFCFFNARLNSEWYSSTSVFHHKALANELLTALYDLNDLQFDLDPKDPELDMCWPSYSRKQYGAVYNWRPPSRTGSVASLCSIPNLEIYPNIASSSLASDIIEDETFAGNEMLYAPNDSATSLAHDEELENMRRTVAETAEKYERASKRIHELEEELASRSRSCMNEEATQTDDDQLDVKVQKETQATTDDDSGCPPGCPPSSEKLVEDGTGVCSDGSTSGGDDLEQLAEATPDLLRLNHVLRVATAPEQELNSEETERSFPLADDEGKEACLLTIKSLQQQLIDAINRGERLAEELAATRSDAEKLPECLSEIETLNQENKRLAEENLDLSRELSDMEMERNQMELRMKEENFFEKAFQDSMKDTASLETDLELQNKKGLELLIKLQKSEAETHENRDALERALQENRNLSGLVEEKQKAVEELTVAVSVLRAEVAASDGRIRELEQSHATSSSDLEQVENKFRKEMEQISREKTEMQGLVGEKEETCARLRKMNSEVEETLKEVTEKSERNNDELVQLRKKITELEEKLESNRTELKMKESVVELLKESVEKAEIEMEEALRTKQTSESEKMTVTETLQQKSEELEKLTTECQRVKVELTETKTKLEELDKRSKSLTADFEKRIGELEEDLENLSGSVQRREKMWEHARECMEKAILEKESHIQDLERVVADGMTKQKLIETEQKLKDLEEALEAQKIEKEVEQERATVQLDDLKQCLGSLEHDKFLISSQLHEANEILKQERKSFGEDRLRWKEESETMDSDIKALKKQIIKLVREKADLWQKTDDLTYEQRLRAAHKWMKSSDVTSCLICCTQFSVTVRKHHCRLCGRVLCYNCCNNWTLTPHSRIKERVCNECVMNMSMLDTLVNSRCGNETDSASDESISCDHKKTEAFVNNVDMEPDEEAGDQSTNSEVREPLERAEEASDVQVESLEPLNSTAAPMKDEEAESRLNEDHQECKIMEPCHVAEENREPISANGETAKDDVDEPVDGAECSRTVTGSSAWSLADGAKAAVSWMSSAASVTTSLASGLLPRNRSAQTSEENDRSSLSLPLPVADEESVKCDDQSPNISKEESVADSDPYDVITPEEISESRLCPVPDPNVTCSCVVKLSDLDESQTTLSEDEVTIKAGKCFAVPVSIESSGTKLIWEFSTQPKGISFAVMYKESDVLPYQECSYLIPVTRLNSHHQTVTGELTAKKIGVYTLFFDNATSRFTAKKLKYRLKAETNGDSTYSIVDASSQDVC